MINQYATKGGVLVQFEEKTLPYDNAIKPLISRLNNQRGALFASSFEYPGRYTCWDIGFVNPPLVISCKEDIIDIEALNGRGAILMQMIKRSILENADLRLVAWAENKATLSVVQSDAPFDEEARSRQPSVFSLLRLLLDFFASDEDHLGFFGAFAYDLIFQFEDLQKHHLRLEDQRDIVLYLPDELYVVNHRTEKAFLRRYDFLFEGLSTHGLARDGSFEPWEASSQSQDTGDHLPGEYAALVEKAKQKFACGDLFEVVPSQTFYEHYSGSPGALFERMREQNPSPYGFLINLGDDEFLVGASPEMFVRKKGRRIETCPISGTVKRGKDAIEDAKNIEWLLASEKEASELTMCTDVDRNDKSRICEAGSVQVIGRRQIEMYSRLIHTVDHVEGTLREGYDAVDAFLTHMWVVTVTGAPKVWAMQFIEENEKSSRRWYAGAVGWFGFNGHINTGLVLRTIRLTQGLAEIRVGATLLFDSDPASEEQETQLKASAFLDLVRGPLANKTPEKAFESKHGNKNVLIVDHQDSFVHTLSNYFRQTGAQVTTIRHSLLSDYLKEQHYDLVVLSPGPGRPKDFNVSQSIAYILARKIPIFGVCLGLQGIVEYFGGSLGTLDYPIHGKASIVHLDPKNRLFKGLEKQLSLGRYHSLFADAENLPKELCTIAQSDDGVIMAVAHQSLPVYAVQFHPETILSMGQQAGLHMIMNMMDIIDAN